MPGKPAAFIDRDDTLLDDEGYMSRPEQVKLFPGALEALLALQEAGITLVLVSNQSGVSRGYFDQADVMAIQARMMELLPGVEFASFEYCFHTPDEGCPCRKPQPLMILRAAHRLGLDLSRSVMIGDRVSDVGAGQAAGCKTLFLNSDEALIEEAKPDHAVGSLADGVEWILEELGQGAGA